MSASPSTEHHSGPSVRRPGLPWWLAGAASILGTLAVNLLLWGIGPLVGAAMTHPDPYSGEVVAVTVGDVAFASAVPLAVGFTAAVALSLLWRGVLRVAQVTGSVLALATVANPLFLLPDTDTATRVVLSLMHVTLVPAVWLGLEAVRRRALAS